MKRSTLAIASLSVVTCGLFSANVEAQYRQELPQMQQSRQHFSNGPANAEWQYGVQNGSGFGQTTMGSQQYRSGTGLPGNQTYPYGTSNRSRWTYQGANSALTGSTLRQYQNDPRRNTQIRWGEWSEWKPVNDTVQQDSSYCPLPGQTGRVTNQQFGMTRTGSATRRRINLSGGADSTLGRRSTLNADSTLDEGTSGQTGSTVTTRRRRSTSLITNMGTSGANENAGSLQSTGAVTGKTADGFEVGSVGGP